MSAATHHSPREFRDAVAVVTGAGSGVGAAVCALLADAGAMVVLVGRDAEKLTAVQETLSAPSRVIAGDVGESAFCRQVADGVKTLGGAARLLVNNAGVMRRGSVEQTDDAAWNEVMQTNVNGVFYMSREMLPVMEDGGAIVNTASTCGLVGAPGLAAYCASKGAVVQLTRAMALDCAARRMTVNAVCPGAIDAPMLFSAHADGATADSIRARNAAAIPLGAIAAAAEVARAILYLAREPHITGTMLSVDGGYCAK